MPQTTIPVFGKLVPAQAGTPLLDSSDTNNDLYGPYASVAAAHSALSAKNLNVIGQTVGINAENNTVVEYWYQGGTAQANLVEKEQGGGVEQIQSDWNQTNTSAKDYIKNKPTIPSVPSLAAVATSGSYNDLSNKPIIPDAQIQADWNQSNSSAKDFIKNKPNIPDVSGKANKSEMSVTPGTGSDADKTTIQLKSGTTATVLTQHQDISGKANIANVYTKSETYTKEEVNNLVSTPTQGYVTVEATNQTTDAATLIAAEVPAADQERDDAIYRIGNWDGSQYDTTKYSEYAWNGSDYVFLNVKSAGIDAAPVKGSHNFLESGAIYNESRKIKHDTDMMLADDIAYNTGDTNTDRQDPRGQIIGIATDFDFDGDIFLNRFYNTTSQLILYLKIQIGSDYINFDVVNTANQGNAISGVRVFTYTKQGYGTVKVWVKYDGETTVYLAEGNGLKLNKSLVDKSEYLKTLATSAVKTIPQSLLDSEKVQARNNIEAAASELIVDSVDMYATQGFYRYGAGDVLYFAGASGFCVSKIYPIKVGMKIKTNTTFLPPYDTALSVFFDENATTNLSTPVAVADLEANGEITITQAMWNAGYRYISISYNLSATANPKMEIATSMEKAVKDLIGAEGGDGVDIAAIEDAIFDEETLTYDNNSPEYIVGYYRVDVTPPAKNSQSGFHRMAIPIQAGDVITTNSSVPGTDAAGHVLIDGSDNMTKIVPTGGVFTITNAMIQAGARMLGISWQDSVTPTVSVSVARKTNMVEVLKTDNTIQVKKVNSTMFKVFIPSGNGQRVCYIFEKEYKKWDSLSYTDGGGVSRTANNIVSCDFWNNASICINDGVDNTSAGYIIQGNTNMIYKIVGAPNHVGNGHGCEKSIYRKFFADGKELDIEGMSNNESVTCKAFRYIQKSECYATAGSGNYYTTTYPQLDTNGNPIVDNIHYMDCLFELGNKVTIKNRMQVQRNGIQFYALYDAMLECNYDKFRYVYVNNAENTINQVLGYAQNQTTPIASSVNLRTNNDQLANIVEMYGVGHFVRQTVIDDDPSRHNKHTVHCEFYENTGRLKNYFQSIGASSISSTGVQTETFNAGDVISCTAIREIELK